MNQHLDFQPKKPPKSFYLAILLIAIGLHLLVLSPLIAPHLIMPIFEHKLTQGTQKSPLSIRLIYKKEDLDANQISSEQAIFERKTLTELDPKQAERLTPFATNRTSIHLDITNDSLDDAARLNIDPTNNSLLDTLPSNIGWNQETLNFTPDLNLTKDQNSISEQFNINSNSQSLKTEEDDKTKTRESSLSQSLENTQTDSFSEGLESSNADKAMLEHIFSNKTQQQLVQAEETQTQYEEAQVEEINYAITEDSDGTRYVNIKGICWRIPPPGTEKAWTIVYAGCSGQTKTFNIEFNIGMDILGPDSPLAID